MLGPLCHALCLRGIRMLKTLHALFLMKPWPCQLWFCIAQCYLFILSVTTSFLEITLFLFDLVNDLLMSAETKSKS